MIPGRQTHCSRGWVVQLVAALVALLATILSSAPPSAVANAGTETRVRASASVVEVLVAPPPQEIAGHRLGNDAAGAGIVVATGVAANGGDDLTRVGRWMSPDEHASMVRTGEVQVGGGGTTYVSHPPSVEVWRRQTDPGNLFVEFDVPRGVLHGGGQPGHAQIPSPNHILGRLAAKRGSPVQSPVPACNIVVVTSC